MERRITCEDGEHCHKCTTGAELLKLGISPSFVLNEETGHCNHFADHPYYEEPQRPKN
jgi:hypothetical protein